MTLRDVIYGAEAAHALLQGFRDLRVHCHCGEDFFNHYAYRGHRASCVAAVVRSHLTSDEAVERGARAIHDGHDQPQAWEDAATGVQTDYLADATNVLTAALGGDGA